MLEDMGNAVKILGVIVPAVNIQVENVPGYLEHCDGTLAWYGIYFEILFENGELWIVEEGAEGGKGIEVEVSSQFPSHFGGDEPQVIHYLSWETFLDDYKINTQRHAF